MVTRRVFLSGSSIGILAPWVSHAFAQKPSFDSTLSDWSAVANLLQKILMENILPFWYPKTLDTERGGYMLNHDIMGNSKGSTNKRLVVQARCVWFYSRLVHEGWGTKEHLAAAKLGYEFLRDYLWDKQSGGFFWEVDAIGKVATMPDKHLYGQSFALYALSEYARASGEQEPVTLAKKLFSLLEYYAYDPQFGGYIESFRRDWSLPSAVGQSYMSAPHDRKLMNTHLHLMEAFTTYFNVCHDQVARERLLELILIQSNTVLRKKLGACTDQYYRNWTPVRGPQYDRVSYGHDLENIWLLMEACQAAGLPDGALSDLYTMLFGYSLQFGFDSKEGGFFNSGTFNNVADNRSKVWWVQSEALVAALRMYQRTREEVYSKCFRLMVDWISKRQVDWTNGEWFSTVPEKGAATGDKANAWKSPYHNGRAMMECLRILKDWI